jgi:hypothetical protein
MDGFLDEGRAKTAHQSNYPFIQYFSGNGQPVGGDAGFNEGFLQTDLAELLHGTIDQSDVASELVPCGGPNNGRVRWKFPEAGFYRDTAELKIIVAGKKHLRIRFVGIHTDKIADVPVIEAGTKIGR